MRTSTFRTAGGAAALLALAACTASSRGPVPASPTPAGVPTPAGRDSGTFVTLLGVDTVAVEQFTRSGDRIEGTIVQRAPSTQVQHYVVTLTPEGTASRIVVRARRADGTILPGRPTESAVEFTSDSALLTVTTPDSVITRRFAARGGTPLLANSFGLYELALRRLRTSGTDSADIQFVNIGATQPAVYPARIVGADSARVYYFGAPQQIRLDARGRVLGVDATGTTNKIVVHRTGPVDIAALASAFAARDARGASLGPSSPRDTVRASIAGADLLVDYGRPSRRGRDLWAHGVLGDTLWRTGANAATQFRTSRTLEIGGRTLPPGTYTLFTRAGGTGYELIVNRQTGQWGTEYHPEQDVMRVPLVVGTVAEHERFTIALLPDDGPRGRLALRWGTRELSVPFTVR